MSYYVYIMSCKSGVLYIGATNDLDRRVFEHKQGLIEGFTKKVPRDATGLRRAV